MAHTMTRADWDALTADEQRALVRTKGVVHIEASPEQKAAYEARLRADETGWPRELQRRGEVSRDEADAMVRAARVRRGLRRAKLRAAREE